MNRKGSGENVLLGVCVGIIGVLRRIYEKTLQGAVSSKALSLLFVLCLLISMVSATFPAYAQDEMYHAYMADASVMRSDTCPTCGWMLYELCRGDYSSFAGYDTHNYGFLGTGGTCTVSSYTGRLYLWCNSCRYAPYYSDGQWCYDIHRGCGKDVDIKCAFRDS